MKHVFFVASAFLLLLGSSCRKVVGHGDVITETRSVTNFTEIATGLSAKVYVEMSPEYKVEITAQQNIADVIQTIRSGSRLEIKTKPGTILRSHEDIIIHIGLPQLTSLQVSGSGSVYTLGTITGQVVEFNVSGSGNLEVQDLDLTGQLHSRVSGSGNVQFNNGSADFIDLDVSGSGDIDAANVEGRSGNVHISGSGSTRLWVRDELEAHISGSGSVYYRGDPAIDAHVSGSGKIKKI